MWQHKRPIFQVNKEQLSYKLTYHPPFFNSGSIKTEVINDDCPKKTDFAACSWRQQNCTPLTDKDQRGHHHHHRLETRPEKNTSIVEFIKLPFKWTRMVFAAGCVFSSVSKHGPHKSFTLSLNKSSTVRERSPRVAVTSPKKNTKNLALIHAASAGNSQLHGGPKVSISSASHRGDRASPETANRHAFVRIATFLPLFLTGGPFVPRAGRLDAQPVSPVAFMQARKVAQLGRKGG